MPDRIQIFSILFSLAVFLVIFSLVKRRRVKEEYSILWFATSLAFIYLSLDRLAVDRLGDLFGIAYKPTILLLIIAGFITLVLIHITVVITRLADQNKEMIQELALANLRRDLAELPPNCCRNSHVLAIVPAYNEKDSIGQVIFDLSCTEMKPDILVVNDGSRDGTGSVARATGLALVLDLPNNLGIGGAVQAGFKYAQRNGYEIAFQFDADGQHLAAEVATIVRVLQERQADMVIGSRFLQKNTGYRSTCLRRFGIRAFEIINSLLIRQRITDNTSGFRAYGRRAIEFLAAHYPVDYPEPEAVILLGRNGFRIVEEPTLMRERQAGGSSIAGIRSAYYMIKVLLAIGMTSLRKPVQIPGANRIPALPVTTAAKLNRPGRTAKRGAGANHGSKVA
jgi:hypothetical protein